MSRRHVVGILSAISVAALVLLVLRVAPERDAADRAGSGGAATAGASELRAGSRRGASADAPSAEMYTPPSPPPPPPVRWQPRSIRGRLLFPDGSPAAKVRIGLGSVATRPSLMSRSRSY